MANSTTEKSKKIRTAKMLRYTEARATGATPTQAAEIAPYADPTVPEKRLQSDPELLDYMAETRRHYVGELGTVALVLLQSIARKLADKPSEDFLLTMLERFNGLILGKDLGSPKQPVSGPNIQVNVGDQQKIDALNHRVDSLREALERRDRLLSPPADPRPEAQPDSPKDPGLAGRTNQAKVEAPEILDEDSL